MGAARMFGALVRLMLLLNWLALARLFTFLRYFIGFPFCLLVCWPVEVWRLV